MKAIMYHYVQEDHPSFPNFNHLHVEDFKKQLDFFEMEYGIVSKAEFLESLQTGAPLNGVLLTFDDGLKCHYEHVFPILKERGMWGMFYVSTAMYAKNKLLDVHKIHLLLGQEKQKDIYDYLMDTLQRDYLVDSFRDDFKRFTYQNQINDNYIASIKRILNYYISYDYREQVIDELCHQFLEPAYLNIDKFYISPNEMIEMEQAGMVIGSHTAQHPVLSKLDATQQEEEIKSSFNHLYDMGLKLEPKTFCYPYGGFHSFTDETVTILERENCLFSFNVESRDISEIDLKDHKQTLPRFDCNEFPFGQVRRIKKSQKSNF